MDGRRVVRAILFLGEAAMRTSPDRRIGGSLHGAALAVLALLSAYPPVRLPAQDTSAIDRGVRIGIIYRPGVRPGLVVLPGPAPALDSAHHQSGTDPRSEEHTSELQSLAYLVCRLLLEKKKKNNHTNK